VHRPDLHRPSGEEIEQSFNSNRNYEVFWGETKEKRAFEDRHASTQAYIDYMRPPFPAILRAIFSCHGKKGDDGQGPPRRREKGMTFSSLFGRNQTSTSDRAEGIQQFFASLSIISFQFDHAGVPFAI
jgi:hypothetical protein